MAEVYQQPRPALWPRRLAAVYNAAHPQKTDRAAYEMECVRHPRGTGKFNVVGEGGFLMLDPLGQGVLCG
jgi:hypothetical protein